MPPPAILDPSQLDFSRLIANRDEIARALPHRYEFQLLDGLVFFDTRTTTYAGFHDVRSDAWWTRGHIPQRPLFPGVLMIEIAAQLSSYVWQRASGERTFLGLVGVDAVKYRGTVEPPCRFVVACRGREMRRRRVVCETQGFVGNTMVFESVITGMPV